MIPITQNINFSPCDRFSQIISHITTQVHLNKENANCLDEQFKQLHLTVASFHPHFCSDVS